MMSQELHDFFEVFGTEEPSVSLPASNTLEQNVVALAEHYEDTIQPGHGLFFDFSQTPELEKPLIDYLVNGFGWTLEKPFFIRKSGRKKPSYQNQFWRGSKDSRYKQVLNCLDYGFCTFSPMVHMSPKVRNYFH